MKAEGERAVDVSRMTGLCLAAGLAWLPLLSGAQPARELPPPQFAPGELPRPRCNALSREALSNSIPAPPQVQAQLTPELRGELYAWAQQKFGYAQATCIEWPFVLRKLQQALGLPVTGALDTGDVDKLKQIFAPARLANGEPAQRAPGLIAADLLPAPSVAAGELNVDCQPEAGKPPPRRPVSAPAIEAELRKDPQLGFVVFAWGGKHLNAKFDSCLNLGAIYRKLQQTLGHEVTGVLMQADLDVVRAALAQGKAESARQGQAVAERADVEAGRTRTVADFLPGLGNSYDNSCGVRQDKAKAQLRQEIARRVAQLPPHMMRSAVTGGIEREEVARANMVDPAWQQFWQSEPALEAWASANRCNVSLRIKIEAWQAVIGKPANALDPAAIPDSQRLIAEAQERLRKFSGQVEQTLIADAERSGETARARRWALDELSGRSKLAALADQIPTALCSTKDSALTCFKGPACAAEYKEADDSKRWAGFSSLVAGTPNSLKDIPPSAAANAQRVAKADEALKQCVTRYPHTAVAKSSLTFAGQAVRAAKLDFDAQGLVGMQLTMESGIEAVRGALTRKYGVPESQQQTRTRVEMLPEGGGTAVTTSGRLVTVSPTLQPSEVSYSVTRYVWKTPKVLIEESTGTLQFRFAGN